MRFLTSLFLLFVPCVYAQADMLSAVDPWVREMPPVAEHSAGYVTLVNTGAEDRELVAVDTSLFSRAELHESREEGGMASMRPVEGVVIPAGGEVSLQPGGYHMMLMNRQVESLTSEDTVPLTLRFDDGSEIEVEAEVRRQAPHGSGHGHHQH